MRNGGGGKKKGHPANDRGTGPTATLASPDSSADKKDISANAMSPIQAKFFSAARVELTGGDFAGQVLDDPEDDGTAEAEISAAFRRKLMGLRHLRRDERAQAFRAAREWRFLALKALRDKRANDRRAKYALRHLRKPRPS